MSNSFSIGRRYAILILVSAFLIATGTLSLFFERSAPVLIGFVGGLSGRVADLGISGRNGAVLAVEQKNSTGGINNSKPLRLIVMDDKQNENKAKDVVNELVDDGVSAIVGHMTSSMSMSTVHLINEAKTVMISPTTTTTLLSYRDDYFFRVCATTKIQAEKMASYLSENLGIKNVSFVYDLSNRGYTESWYADFLREFEKNNGRIALTTTYTSGPDVLFDSIADDILSQSAEAVIIIASAMDTAMLGQQIRKRNKTIQLISSEWASASEVLIELGGVAVEGMLVTQFFDRYSKEPAYLDFKEKYIKRFGSEPGFASVYSYDAMTVLISALEEQTSGQRLKDSINKIAMFKGALGEITIDRFGDARRKSYLTIVHNGKYQVVE